MTRVTIAWILICALYFSVTPVELYKAPERFTNVLMQPICSLQSSSLVWGMTSWSSLLGEFTLHLQASHKTHFYCNAKTLFTYTGPVFAYLGGRGLGGKVLVQLVHCEREDWNRDDNLSLSPQGGRGNFIAISGCSLTSGWVLDREVKRDMYVASRDLPTHCPLALTKYELVPSSMLCLKFKFVNMVWNCLAKNFLTWRLK